MTGAIDHPFQIGTKVVRVTYYRWGNQEPDYVDDEVAKLYKTGKFILKSDCREGGSHRQYSAGKDWEGEWRGFSKHNNYVPTPDVYVATETLLAKVVVSRAKTKQRKLIDSLAERIKRIEADGSADMDKRLESIEALIPAKVTA